MGALLRLRRSGSNLPTLLTSWLIIDWPNDDSEITLYIFYSLKMHDTDHNSG